MTQKIEWIPVKTENDLPAKAPGKDWLISYQFRDGAGFMVQRVRLTDNPRGWWQQTPFGRDWAYMPMPEPYQPEPPEAIVQMTQRDLDGWSHAWRQLRDEVDNLKRQTGARFEVQKDRLDEFETRLTGSLREMDETFATINRTVADIMEFNRNMDDRIDSLQTFVGNKHQRLEVQLSNRMNGHEHRLDRIENEVSDLEAGLATVERKIDR